VGVDGPPSAQAPVSDPLDPGFGEAPQSDVEPSLKGGSWLTRLLSNFKRRLPWTIAISVGMCAVIVLDIAYTFTLLPHTGLSRKITWPQFVSQIPAIYWTFWDSHGGEGSGSICPPFNLAESAATRNRSNHRNSNYSHIVHQSSRQAALLTVSPPKRGKSDLKSRYRSYLSTIRRFGFAKYRNLTDTSFQVISASHQVQSDRYVGFQCRYAQQNAAPQSGLSWGSSS
jgi:hypothetical protein